MGLPMVQKDTRRRSSLILGILLALLLGAAAGFLVLAVPIHMLETVTTSTRLSKLMVQAEPPISPSDRTLLAVLAGIFTAGIGWVLVDWLVFGRAGMSRLIKPREDEYEDEDGDSFRPTDPLDLVSPVSLPVQEWAPPPSGDARRPLSARTDIGDPPKPAPPFGIAAMPQPGLDPSPNPFGQILPGVGAAAPPLYPNVPPLIRQPAAPAPTPPPSASWPPLELSTPQSAASPMEQTERVAPSAPGWLPVPGLRPDGGQPRFDAEEKPVGEDGLPQTGPAATTAPPPPAVPQQPHDIAAPKHAPLTPPSISFDLPATPDPVAIPTPFPAAPAPVTPTPVKPAPAAAAPPPVQATAGSSIRPASEPGFDKARLEELLARLERGLQNRRAAAAAAAPPPAPVAAPAPHPAAPPPPKVEPPAAYAAPIPAPPPMAIHAQPPSQPAPIFHIAPVQAQPAAPTPAPAPPPLVAPTPVQLAESTGRNDAMLDQPLHVTLDLLRGMVKR